MGVASMFAFATRFVDFTGHTGPPAMAKFQNFVLFCIPYRKPAVATVALIGAVLVARQFFGW